MRKRFALLAAVVAFTMSLSGPAFAVPEQPGKGNPEVTTSGKCPPGQNKETSTGGLKKCP